MGTLHALILWLYLNVWGNIVASAICGVAAFGWARRELLKLHKRHDEAQQQRERHHREILAAINDQAH